MIINTTLNPYKNILYRPQVISFGAMKKSQFNGIDLNVIERFKAPIEKFNGNEDLQKWAAERYKAIAQKNYGGFTPFIVKNRIEGLKKWTKFLDKSEYKDTLKLLIINAFTKDLDKNNILIIPLFDAEVLDTTLGEINKKIKTNPKIQFDFAKIYKQNFQDRHIQRLRNSDNWTYIPSIQHDKKNFDANIEMLRILSARSWCTRTFKTEQYLTEGDMHIYTEKDKPELAIRFSGDDIVEIQGYLNNYKIPLNYYNILIAYLNKLKVNKFLPKAKKALEEVKIREAKVSELKKTLATSIKNNDNLKIFETLGINAKKDSNGNLILSHYSTLFDDGTFSFADLGINENDLFHNVVKIEGKADFISSNLTSFYNLEEIGGSVDLYETKIKDFGKLKKINGSLRINNSKINTFGELEKIKGSLVINASKIGDFGNLKTIGKTALFMNSTINDLKNLKIIKGIANFHYTKIKNIGKLKSIGKLLNIENANISEKDKKYIIKISKEKPQ